MVVLLHKRLNLLKCITTHVACDESDLLVLGNLLSLEQEEEVLLHKLVVELAAVSMIEIRLGDVYDVA